MLEKSNNNMSVNMCADLLYKDRAFRSMSNAYINADSRKIDTDLFQAVLFELAYDILVNSRPNLSPFSPVFHDAVIKGFDLVIFNQ